jgi:O-acetyl-ADP-ribose deacetylase (regulator of RNase III)
VAFLGHLLDNEIHNRSTTINKPPFCLKADVLVNSALPNLNELTACGRALMARGGSRLREACKPHTAIPQGDIVATESGDLSCKFVIHAVCCNLGKFREASLAHEV